MAAGIEPRSTVVEGAPVSPGADWQLRASVPRVWAGPPDEVTGRAFPRSRYTLPPAVSTAATQKLTCPAGAKKLPLGSAVVMNWRPATKVVGSAAEAGPIVPTILPWVKVGEPNVAS